MKRNKVRKIKSINVALLIRFVAFATGIIVVLGLSCFFIVGGAFNSQAQGILTKVGQELTQTINSSNDNQSSVESKISECEFAYGVNAFVLSPEGALVITDSDFDAVGDVEEVVNGIKKQLAKANGEFAIYKPNSDNMYYVSNVNFKGDNYLLICFNLGVSNKTVSAMQTNILWISIFSIVVATLVSFTFAQRISRPIKKISETSLQLTKGNYSIDFSQAEFEELANLSNTLNYVKDEIKKTETFQRELLANVSHDLKTPLTMIKAYASMIQEISGDNPEKREKHLQVIIDEADRLTGLVNDVLNVSKVYSELDELQMKVFNITEFLYGILNKFGYLQETQGFTFMVDVDANLYTFADEGKIGQVFYNLISNAVNYTGADKTVYVSLKDCPEENRIKFTVRDTGKGINEEDVENIWDRYYRTKDSHERPVKGTGLGLNIVKYILQKHSFDFGVKSKVGEGSAFWVDFPKISALSESTEQ